LYIPYVGFFTVARKFRQSYSIGRKTAMPPSPALLDGEHQAAQVLSPTSEYVAAGEPGVVVRNPTQDPEAGEVK
jgi:hypothetical protein